MNIDHIALVMLGTILIGAVASRRRFRTDPLKSVLAGAAASMLATAVAAICYVATDLGEFTISAVFFSPIFEGAVVAALAAVVLGTYRHRANRAAFAAAIVLTGAVLAWAVGHLFVGHSPHFSHDRAVAFLVVSWTVAATATAVAPQFAPNKSLERTRER
jgi:MFS family permease